MFFRRQTDALRSLVTFGACSCATFSLVFALDSRGRRPIIQRLQRDRLQLLKPTPDALEQSDDITQLDHSPSPASQPSSGAMAQPSTPAGRTGSSTLVGKLFNKLRTPNSASPSSSSNNSIGRSSRSPSPSVSLRRSSSRSSFHCLGSGPSSTSLHSNASSSTLPLATALNGLASSGQQDDDSDLELPQFESDFLKNLQRNTGERITVGNGSPYSSQLDAPTTQRPSLDQRRRLSPPRASLDTEATSSRKSSFLSKSATASSTEGGAPKSSLGRTWAKGRDALTGASSRRAADAQSIKSSRESASEGEEEDRTVNAVSLADLATPNV